MHDDSGRTANAIRLCRYPGCEGFQASVLLTPKELASSANNAFSPVLICSPPNPRKPPSLAMMKNAPAGLENNPFAAIAAGFATNMVDKVVDSFVTPSGLATVMEGKKPSFSRSRRKNPSNIDQANRDDLFKNARYSYDSLNKFSIYVPTDTGDEIRFILQRDGLSWKMIDMIVPV